MTITLYCSRCVMPSLQSNLQTNYVCDYCENLNAIEKGEN